MLGDCCAHRLCARTPKQGSDYCVMHAFYAENATFAAPAACASSVGTDTSTVEHPQHYNSGIECWDYILSHKHLGFCEGNVIKYVTRYKLKNNAIEDLRKAQAYLDRLVDECLKEAQMDMKTGEIMTDEEVRRRYGDAVSEDVTQLSSDEAAALVKLNRHERRAALARMRKEKAHNGA